MNPVIDIDAKEVGQEHLAAAARVQEDRRRMSAEIFFTEVERLATGIVVGILAVITVSFPSFIFSGIWYLVEHKFAPLGAHMPFLRLWAWWAGGIIAVLAAFGAFALIRRGDTRFWRVIKHAFE